MRIKFTELPKVEHALIDSVIVRTERFGGYWGRGKDVAEAIKNATWIGSQDSVYVCQCDNEARCDAVEGNMYTAARGPIYKGKVMANKRDVMVTAVHAEGMRIAADEE